jgi:pimeloyl-ACP methyl ester carboxylesterase
VPAATVNGQRLEYTDNGKDAPVLVFSHGLLMDGEMFEPQVRHFGDRFRCVTWDQRGHGRTGRAEHAFTYWDSAEDLCALCRHLGIARATFVGMSQGGFLQLRLALRHPEIVDALIFIDSQAGPEDPTLVPQYEAMIETVLKDGYSDVILEMTYAAVIGPDFPGKQHWLEKWRSRDPRDVVEPFKTLVRREDLHSQLREITAHALVVHGSADAAIPVELGERLCRELPGCDRFELIEGGGHASNLTHPAAVNAAMEAFLQRQS